jgi:hypothetical protein
MYTRIQYEAKENMTTVIVKFENKCILPNMSVLYSSNYFANHAIPNPQPGRKDDDDERKIFSHNPIMMLRTLSLSHVQYRQYTVK